MVINGTRRLCRVGLAAVLVTALCALAFVDLPPELPDPLADPPPTLGGGEPPATRSVVAYSWARRLALDYRASMDCTTNETVPTPGVTREKLPKQKKWIETMNEQLYLFSAHFDDRIHDYPCVRVIGVRRGLLGPSIYCTIWYEEDGTLRSRSMEALVVDIWLEEWGGISEMYTGVLITCPLDQSLDRSRVTVGSSSCAQDFESSLEVSGPERTERDGGKRQFTLCIKGLDFDEDISPKLVAFVELHRILGAGYFIFYVFNVHENVMKVLRLYEKSNVVRWFNFTLPERLPNERMARRRLFKKEVWTKRRMELIPYNHCFYESLRSSEYVVPIDIDESIIPARRKNWSQLLTEEKQKLGESFDEYASYAVRNAYFFTELQRRDARLKRDGQTDLWKQIEYLDTVRTRSISPEGDSVKSFISTERTLTVHNHYALTTLNPSTARAHHFSAEDVLKHHHRICDERHLDCELLMQDVIEDKTVLPYGKDLVTRTNVILKNLTAMRKK